MKILTYTILSFIALSTISAQTLPINMYLNHEKHMLLTGGKNVSNFYDDRTLKNVYLEFKQTDYWQQLIDSHDSPNYVMATLTYEDKVIDSIGVQLKGQTSFKKAVELTEKLSFAIELDHFIDGQDIEGYNTFNFNNAYQDASTCKEILYLNLNRRNIPAAQGNFVNVYLNGVYWGVYNNVQQLNGDYLKEWFLTNNGSRWRADAPAITTKSVSEGPRPGSQWGDGTAALNYLGSDTALYQQYYTLKASQQENPWELLVNVCDVLNNTPNSTLLDSISNYLDIDKTLWYLAHETVFSDDDGYVYKGKMDYYIYYEPETGRMVPLEFDGNSALEIRNVNWNPFYNSRKVNYPLMNKLYAVPEIRQRYIAHMRTIIEELLDETLTDSIIDTYHELIKDDVKNETKKIESYAEFETAIKELKSFISQRKSVLNSNSEIAETPLSITDVKHIANQEEFSSPNPNEVVDVIASIGGNANILAVNLYYSNHLVGNFTKIEMADDGEHNDVALSDRIFGAQIPGFDTATFVRYYVEAISNNNAKTASYSPEGAEHDVYFYRVNAAQKTASSIVINEFAASNKSMAKDENNEYDDWIELYNNSDEPISLEGYYLSDNSKNLTKWILPNVSIGANDYLVIWADDDEAQGSLHTNFKLSASGEEIFLVTPDLNIADQVFFTNQTTDISYGRFPNGTGSFKELQATFGSENKEYTSTELKDVSTAEMLKIYPNPVITSLNIETNRNITTPVIIYDINGRALFESSFANNVSIDVSNWERGLYIVKIESKRRLIVLE